MIRIDNNIALHTYYDVVGCECNSNCEQLNICLMILKYNNHHIKKDIQLGILFILESLFSKSYSFPIRMIATKQMLFASKKLLYTTVFVKMSASKNYVSIILFSKKNIIQSVVCYTS